MDSFIASIIPCAFSTVPRGWAVCNGQVVPINQNQALYAVIGIAYGGDGQTTFNLPNLDGRVSTGTGLARWGEACLGRLRGMFALAVWDAAEEKLFLARDPFGIKPLYYHATPGRLAFASELRALLAAPGVPRAHSKQGLVQKPFRSDDLAQALSAAFKRQS
mgnify:CR=1 FL=1